MVDRVIRECGWCDARCELRPVHDSETHPFGGRAAQAAFECMGCRGLNIASWVSQFGHDALQGWEQDEETNWLPRRAGGRNYRDVPEHIGSAADEAHRCFAQDFYRATGSLCRAVIEATAKERGATGKNLEVRIDRLLEMQAIYPFVASAAHEVRHFGNSMAHGDFAEPVQKREAEQALRLMDMVLTQAYEDPAEVERVMGRRLGMAPDASSLTP